MYSSSEMVESFSNMGNSIFTWISAILIIVGTYKIFEKAGVPGWKAIIPFYREFIIFELAGEKKSKYWEWLACYIAIVISFIVMAFAIFAAAIGGVTTGLMTESASVGLGVGAGFVIVFLISVLVMVVATIIAIVLLVKANSKLFMKFGKDKGTSIVLSIFRVIGALVVGFDSSVYQGEFVHQQNDGMNNNITNNNGTSNSVSNSETLRFCTNCGAPVQGKFCPNCGNKIE